MHKKQILTALLTLGVICLAKLALLPENNILHLGCNILLVIALLSFGDLLVYTLLFLPLRAFKKKFDAKHSSDN